MNRPATGYRGTVLITARNVRLDGRAAPLLRDQGWTVIEAPAVGPTTAGIEADDVVALVVGSEIVDDSASALFPNLRCIVRAGAGTDNIRLAGESDRVAVAGLPGLNAQSVADYTMGLILTASRRIAESDRAVRAGGWSALIGGDIFRRTLGIVGLGAVGRAVAARATGFEMSVVAFDPAVHPDRIPPGVEMADLAGVLTRSDVVTLHAPLVPTTRHMIGAPQFALMKSTAILVNAARGELVDERALRDALRNGVIRGAALDVFDDEPAIDAAWRAMDNVVLSPHTASFGSTTMDRLAPEVALALDRLVAENDERVFTAPASERL